MAEPNANGISREKLEDGNILVSLKERFLDDMSEDNLVELMQVLRDSVFIVPMQIIMAESDQERMRLYEENMKLVVENDVQVLPATAEVEGENYIVAFSQQEQVSDELADSVTLMKTPFEQLYGYFLNDNTVNAIILDPFTENLELPGELLDAIARMESRIKEY